MRTTSNGSQLSCRLHCALGLRRTGRTTRCVCSVQVHKEKDKCGELVRSAEVGGFGARDIFQPGGTWRTVSGLVSGADVHKQPTTTDLMKDGHHMATHSTCMKSIPKYAAFEETP